MRALTRLGFLDTGLNADVALLVNAPDNKACLRKIGMLPAARDSSLEVEAKLRAAFLSNKTPGAWQIRKNSEKVLQPVLKILRRAKILPKTPAEYLHLARPFQAIKTYTKRRKLLLQTFNGLAWGILRYGEAPPHEP